jgi:PAS domain S-box-containing protein
VIAANNSEIGRAAEDRSALLAKAADAAVDLAILALDDNGHVLALNSGAQQLTGYSEHDLAGLNSDVLFTPEDLAADAAEQERQMARTQGRAEDERWHMRKDGSRFWGSGVLTAMPNGAGFVKFMRDLTQRRLTEEQLRISEERFRVLATNIPPLVFTSLSDGKRTWGSPQWVIYTGLSDGDSKEFGWLDAVHPDDRELTVEGWRAAAQKGVYEVEHRIRRVQDGEFRWHQTRAMPLPVGNELSSEWVGASTDIHQLRGLKESQQVLLSELQHRTRNLLAVVQTIVRRSARSARSLDDFTVELDRRLSALSRAESLMPRSQAGVVNIRAIIDTELAAHLPSNQPAKVRLNGPAVNIARSSAQPVSLALHELATNAVKYGALAQDSGQLEISWRVLNGGEEKRVVLEWRERGVKMADPQAPRRRGYGTELIERALPYQLSAKTELEYLPDGVRCQVEVPIAGVSEQDE